MSLPHASIDATVPPLPPRAVSRDERMIDLASMGLVLFGVLVVALGWSHLHEIAGFTYQHPAAPGRRLVAETIEARNLAAAGVAIVLAGIAVAAEGAKRHRRRLGTT